MSLCLCLFYCWWFAYFFVSVPDEERGVAPWFEEGWMDDEEEESEGEDEGDQTKNKDWKSIV